MDLGALILTKPTQYSSVGVIWFGTLPLTWYHATGSKKLRNGTLSSGVRIIQRSFR